MSSSDDQIIQSVDGIISAVEKLVGDIRVAPDIEIGAKNFALGKVGAVAKDLDLINRALFFNDYPASSPHPGASMDPEKNALAARAAIIADKDDTLNDMLSSWSQPADTLASQSDDQISGETEGANKPRIVVSPVARKVTEEDEGLTASSHEGDDKQSFSVASSFEESLVSSLTHSETSLIGERGQEETPDFIKTDDEFVSDSEGDSHFQKQVQETEIRAKAEFEGAKADGQAEAELAVNVLQDVAASQDDVVSSEIQVFDDLTLIQGIDAEVAELLSLHGIHTYHDIAEFKEADMLRLSDELSDPCRVSRENWIEQATLLKQGVLTYYAQKNNDDVYFDRLSLNEHFLIHPSVIEEPIVYQQDVSDHFAATDINRDDQSADLDGATEEDEVSLSEITEEPGAEVQEFTDALLAKKQALEAELAALTVQMVKKSEVDQSTENETSFLETNFLSGNVETKTKNEDLISPVVDVLSHEEGQNELTEVSPQIDNEYSSGFEADDDLTDNFSDDLVDGPSDELTDDLGDGAIWHEEVSTGKDYVPPIIDEYDAPSDAGVYVAPEASFAQAQETSEFRDEEEYEEALSDQDEGYGYSVDQLAEHAPVSHLDEMSGFHQHGHIAKQLGEVDEANQASYITAASSEPLHSEIQSGHSHGVSSSEVTMSPQADYMNDISVPREVLSSERPEEASFIERSFIPSDLQADQLQNDQPNETASLKQDRFIVGLQPGETVSDKAAEIKEKIGHDQTLGQFLASKTQSEMGEAFHNEELGQTPREEDSHFRPPLPPQNEELNELTMQDRSIHLPPVPPVAPQMPMSGMRRPDHSARPPMPPSNIPRPPAPPVANGIRVPPPPVREQQGRGPSEMEHVRPLSHTHVAGRDAMPPAGNGGPEARALPPLPPQDLPSQGLQSQGLPMQRDLSPQSMSPHSEEGPPRGAPDMFAPMDEGQAYADTQRIIAAKRRADAERAVNRSDIPDGQAYMDTQQLIENGVPFEGQQNSGYSSGPEGIPPLPPEAMKAASAYPRGAHNSELNYRGQKPQKFNEDRYPPAEDNGERRANQKSDAPTGFKAKAKQFAESLQRSFVDKE